MIQLKLCVLSLILIMVSHSSLQVYMPMCSVTEVPGLLNHTLANFGHIPYGKTIIGELIIPTNSQFCDADNLSNFATAQGDDMKKFILIKRGTCKFTKKIMNAQKKGADLVIIYDNQKTNTPNVIMSNDGHGHLIDIPSVFLSNFDGQKLIATHKKCNSLILKVHFDVFISKVANLTFWLDVNNRQTFITVKNFARDYYKVIAKHINIDVKFKINQNCGRQKCDTQDCVKDKKQYCLPADKIIEGVPVLGKELVNQHLRSYFLFKSMKDTNKVQNWFSYMAEFDKNLCMEKLDLKQCSLSIIKQFVKPQTIETKVLQTYTNMNQGKQNMLQTWVEDAYKADILFYPQASINGRNFYGLFRAPDIFEMICESLQKPPSECHSFMKNDRKQTFGQNQTIWKAVLLIILCMLVLFFVVLFVYNRLIRRQLNQQMSMEVNKMVEHYVAMTQQKSRSNADM